MDFNAANAVRAVYETGDVPVRMIQRDSLSAIIAEQRYIEIKTLSPPTPAQRDDLGIEI